MSIFSKYVPLFSPLLYPFWAKLRDRKLTKPPAVSTRGNKRQKKKKKKTLPLDSLGYIEVKKQQKLD